MSRYEIRFKDLKVSSSKQEENGYVLKLENAKTGKFEFVIFKGQRPVESSTDLYSALRSVLITAHYGQMKPEVFCREMMIRPEHPKAQETFLKARRVCQQLDTVVPLDYATKWLDMAKELGQKGLTPNVE